MFYEFPNGVFLNNKLYWHFLYCFDFNPKKFLVEEINIYNQQLNIWRNNCRSIFDGVERLGCRTKIVQSRGMLSFRCTVVQWNKGRFLGLLTYVSDTSFHTSFCCFLLSYEGTKSRSLWLTFFKTLPSIHILSMGPSI